MGWLLAIVLLMAGAFLGVFIASLMLIVRQADDAMADLWDDDEEDA
jgi:hypothetical protein